MRWAVGQDAAESGKKCAHARYRELRVEVNAGSVMPAATRNASGAGRRPHFWKTGRVGTPIKLGRFRGLGRENGRCELAFSYCKPVAIL